MTRYNFISLISILLLSSCGITKKQQTKESYPFRKANLIPWSIVTFDSQKRDYRQRVEMVKELGFEQYAFGGGAEHSETMKEEWELAAEEGIKISSAWLWMDTKKDQPGSLQALNLHRLATVKETGIELQLWLGFNKKYFAGLSKEAAFLKGKAMVEFLCKKAESMNCKIALYNHGGWMGNIDNQLSIIRSLPQYDIGIIYNFHHGHHDIDHFTEVLEKILPYLWCVNLNGMKKDGPQILTIGEGDYEKEMIKAVLKTNYQGPWGILGHVKGGDPAVILNENVKGLYKLFPQK